MERTYLTKLIVAGLLVAGGLGSGAAMARDTGNINLYLGQKAMADDDDWEPVEEQDQLGLLFDYQPSGWPVAVAVDLLASEDDATRNGVDYEGATTEFAVGARKYFNLNMSRDVQVRPFIGGGLTFISAERERPFGLSSDDDDSALGVWLGGGAMVTFARHWNVGAEIRISRAEVELFDEDVEAGGDHFGFVAGYRW